MIHDLATIAHYKARLADGYLSPGTTLERFQEGMAEAVMSRLSGALLCTAEDAIRPGFTPEWIELPPDDWSPERRRSEIDKDEVEEIRSRAQFVATERATLEQLWRSLSFELWHLGPELERVAALIRVFDGRSFLADRQGR